MGVKRNVIPSLLALSTALASCSAPSVFASPRTQTSMQMKEISVNGNVYEKPYGFSTIDPGSGKLTEYLPLWYIQRVMLRLGVQSSWNGVSINILAPNGFSPGTLQTIQPKTPGPLGIYVNGKFVLSTDKIVRVDPYSGRSTTFVPIWYIGRVLAQMQAISSWNGQRWNFGKTPTTLKTASPTKSLVFLSDKQIIAGQQTVTIHVVPKDANGNSLGAGQSITVADGNGNTLTATWNETNQDYEVVSKETIAGTYTYVATIGATPLKSTPNLTVLPGSVSAAHTSVSVENLGTGTVVVKVVPKDALGNDIGAGSTISVNDGNGHSLTATWNSTNKDYEVSFQEPSNGTYTFTASMNGLSFPQQPSTTVSTASGGGAPAPAPAPAPILSPTLSKVSSAQANVVAGLKNVSIVVSPLYTNGLAVGSGQTVTVSDGVGKSQTATWNSTNNDYEVTFSETAAATYTYTATVGNTTLTNTAKVIVANGAFSGASSTVTAPATGTAGNGVLVQVVPRDAYGNGIGAGQTVTVSDGTNTQTATWNSTNNDYEATFTEATAGTYTFSATMSGVTFTQQAQTTVGAGSLASLSTVSGPQGSIHAGTSNVTISVVPKDSKGNPLGSGQTVTVSDGVGKPQTAIWNSTNNDYEVTFSETTAGTYTYTATVGSTTLTNTAKVIVAPGPVSGANSTVTAPATATAGSGVLVQVVPKDAYGNAIGSGQTVTVSDGTNTQTATWNSTNQDYEATYTEGTAGPYTFSATMSGITFTQQAQTTVSAGSLVSLSTVSGPQGSIHAGASNVTISVVPKDSKGNPLGSGQTVTVSDGVGKPLTATWNSTHNDYEVTFSETAAGTYTYTATVGSTTLTNTAQVIVVPASVSGATSTVKAPATATAGSGVLVQVVPIDAYGNKIGSGQTVTVSDGTNTQTATWNNTNQDYEATYTEAVVGTYTFSATMSGVTFTQQAQTTVGAGSLASLSTVSGPQGSIHAGASNVMISVVPKDSKGNPLGSGQTVTVSDGVGKPLTATWNSTHSDYEVTFSETTAGTYTYTAIVGSTALTNTAQVIVAPASVSGANSTVTAPATATAGSGVLVQVVPIDAYGNKIGSGQTVTVSDGTNTQTATWNSTNKDYEVTFTEATAGTYTFSATMNGVTFTQQAQTTVSAGSLVSLSTVSGPQGSIHAGASNVTISVIPKDSKGNPLGSGQTVTVSDGVGKPLTATWNGTNNDYEATFSETKAGTYTYTATVGSTTLTNTAQVIVAPASVSGATSTVTAPATATAGSGVLVQVVPIDAYGNAIGSGQTVTVSDGTNTQTATWNNTNKDYEVTFTEAAAGTYTFSATMSGVTFTQQAQTTVGAGSLASLSTVSGPQGNIHAGASNVTISVVPKDSKGNPLGSGQTVTVSDGVGKPQTATWNSTNNDYEVTFSETTAGTYTYTATVGSTTLTNTAQVIVAPASVSGANSTVTAPATGTAGSGVLVQVVPIDAYGNKIGSGQTVTVSDGTNTQTATWNSTHNDYEATFTEGTAGTYTFSATMSGVTFTQQAQTTLTAGSLASLSTESGPQGSIHAGASNVIISVVPKDSNGNPLGSGQTVKVSDGTTTQTATWNGTHSDYEATFSETKAGTYTYTATVGSTTLTNTAQVIVAPASVSGATSTVTAPATATAGSAVLVQVVPIDAYGNAIGSGQTVTVSDGTNTQTATWNSTNKDYEVTFTEGTAGNYTFSATMSGVTFTQQAQTTVTAGSLASLSTVSGPQGSIPAGASNVTISVIPKDSKGNPLGSGQTVKVSDGATTQTATWNGTNNDYEVTFSETKTGTYTYTATVGGTTLTNTAQVIVAPGPVSGTTSTITAPATATAGSAVLVQELPKDAYGNAIGSGQTVTVSDGTNTQTATWNSTNKDYETTYTEGTAGTYTFSATMSGVTFTQQAQTTVTAGSLASLSTVSGPQGNIPAGASNVTISVVPKDSKGNPLGSGQTVTVSDGTTTQPATWNSTNSDYEATFSETKAGTFTYTATVGSTTLSNTAQVIVVPGSVNGANSIVTAPATGTAGSGVLVQVVPKDAYGNKIGSGHTVTVSDGTNTQTATWNSTNNDYEATFTEPAAGTYTFGATMSGTALGTAQQVVISNGADATTSVLSVPSQAVTNGSVTVSVIPKNAGGVDLGSGQFVVVSDGTTQQVATWNSGTQSYEAIFTEIVPSLQKFTFSAAVNNVPLTQTGSVYVHALVNANQSSVTAPSTVQAGGTVNVQVVPKDLYGTTITEPQTSISVTDGNGTTHSATWDSTANAYVAAFTYSTTGNETFTAADGGVSLTQQATTTVLPSTPDAAHSTVTAPNEVIAGTNNVAVQITLYDKYGNAIGQLSNGQSLTVSDGVNPPVVAQWDSATSSYQAVMSESSVGTVTFTPTVNLGGGTTVTLSTAQTIIDPSATNSTVTVPTTATAGPNNVLVQVHLKDGLGNPVGSGQTVTVTDGTTTASATWNAANSDYEVTMTETKAGSVQFTATDGKMSIKSSSVAITAGPMASAQTAFVLPSVAVAGTPFSVGVKPYDQYGNPVQVANMSLSDGTTSTPATWNPTNSDYEAQFTETQSGPKTFTATSGAITATSSILNVTAGAVSDPNSIVTGPVSGTALSGSTVSITVVPKDQYGNVLTGSDASVTISDGTTTKTATYSSTNHNFVAQFPETTIQTDAFVATVHDTSTGQATVLSDKAVLVQIQPTNVANPVTPSVTGGSSNQPVSLTSPNLALQLPDYGGSLTSVGSSPTSSSTGDVPFWYFPVFPVTSITSFNQPAQNSAGHSGMLWFDYTTGGVTYSGGSGTPNGDSFFEYTFYLPAPETVSFNLNFNGKPDDAALAWMDNQPMAYSVDIGAYSGWSALGVTMPPASGQVTLAAGPHTVVVEAANAFTPGGGNNAGFGLNLTDASGTVVSTASPTGWKTTGYISSPPVIWYPSGTSYTISEEYLDPNSLTVSQTKQWTVTSH